MLTVYLFQSSCTYFCRSISNNYL